MTLNELWDSQMEMTAVDLWLGELEKSLETLLTLVGHGLVFIKF